MTDLSKKQTSVLGFVLLSVIVTCATVRQAPVQWRRWMVTTSRSLVATRPQMLTVFWWR